MDIRSVFLFILTLVFSYNSLVALAKAVITEGWVSGRFIEVSKRLVTQSGSVLFYSIPLSLILAVVFIGFHPESSPMGMVYLVFLCSVLIFLKGIKSTKSSEEFVDKSLSSKLLWVVGAAALIFIFFKD